MSADAAASEAATHKTPEPQDPVFPFEIDASTLTAKTYKDFHKTLLQNHNNLIKWANWIGLTITYKNHLQTKTAGQETYLQSLVEGSRETAEEYSKLDEKYTQLISDLADTKKELGAARRELAQTKLALVDEQNKNLGTPTNSTTTNSTPPPATPPFAGINETVQRSAKLPDAPEYGGDRDSLEPWIMQLKMKLEENKDWYPTVKMELFYAVTRLTERARNLAQKPVRNEIKEWPTMDAFYEWCRTKFGDPDAAMTARRELKEMRQRNLPFSTFSGDFLNVAAKTTMDEEGKVLALEEAINRELANQMINHERPKKLDEFITLLQNLENRMARVNAAGHQHLARGRGTLRASRGGFSRGQGRGYFTPSYPSSYASSSYSASDPLYSAPSTPGSSVSMSNVSPTAPSTVSPSSSIFNFDMMDLDSLRGTQPNRTFRGKIPFAVSTARRQAGCYLYCGIPGHNQTRCSRFKCYNCGEVGHGT